MSKVEEGLFGRVGADDCHKIGILGGCGANCTVYKNGECPAVEEMEDCKQ